MDGEVCEIVQETFGNGGSSVHNEDDDSYSIEEGDIGSGETTDIFGTYVVIVNDDGSLIVDKSGLIDPAHYDSQTVIPVTLPVNKLANPNNPFPGAKSANQLQQQQRQKRSSSGGGKMRKPKNQSVTQPGPSVQNSVQLVSLAQEDFGDQSGSAPAIDIDQLGPQPQHFIQFNTIGPQDMALLENVLQSAQTDLFADLAFPSEEASSFVEAPQSGGVHLWDHSYSALSAAPQQIEIQVQPRTSDLSQSILVDNKSAAISGSSARRSNVSSPAQSAVSSPSGTSTQSVRRISEGDNLNIRRSQRHQDRQEKQEADRIKAENQLQLQREKELILQKQILEQGGTPDVIVLSPPPVTDQSAVVTPTQFSTPGTESLDGGRRPSRARKVPAHLADPNFVQINDEGKIDEQPMSPTINFDESIVALSARQGEEVDEDEAEEDPEDPNKTWCICKQPHGNKFMICCDKCDDWFHGKCVNVTKYQASVWEKKEKKWFCPICRDEIERQKQQQKEAKRRPSVRRGSYASQEMTEAIVSAEEFQSPAARTPKEEAMPSSGIRRKSSVASSPSVKPSTVPTVPTAADCIMCKSKPSAPGSQFCSSECESNMSQVVPIEVKPNVSSDAETVNEKKNKKPMKQEPEKDKTDSFLTFHVIQPGSKVSTGVVPAKSKETTAIRGLDRRHSAQKVPASPSKATTPTTPTAISGKQFYGSDVEKTPGSVQSSGENTPKSSTASEIVKSKLKTTPKAGSDKRKSKESLEKEKDKRTDTNLIRKNVRKTIREALKQRLSSDTDTKFTPEDADKIAQQIDDELDTAYTFGSSNQQKIMTKFRSIVFNIKDMKNNLYLELLKGKIPAEQLVKMDAKDMANRELSQWREQEEKKELEMIQRAELEKLAEAKKQELLDKGKDVEVVEQVQTKLDISDVLDFKDSHLGTPASSSKKHGDGGEKSHSSSKSHKEKIREKDRHSNTHRSSRDSRRRDDKDNDHKTRHSSRDRDSKSSKKDRDRDRNREKRRSSKDKYRSDKKRHERDRSRSPTEKSKSSDKLRHSSEDKHKNKDPVKEAEKKVPVPEEPVPKVDVVAPELQIVPEAKHVSEAEQELPSSTIMTPDFAEEKKEESATSAFRTRLGMHELGTFAASAYNVSHDKVDGLCFPESPVQIVGRIDPRTVFDYVEKMKKIKDVLVFRLQPESSEDVSKYMTFFSYLATRSRFGVLGGAVSPLKDCYLVPLDKNTPVYPALLPFHGPGLPENRPHCLLALVIRQPLDPLILKRKPPVDVNIPLKKTKLPSKVSGRTPTRSEVPLPMPMPDDDEPYSPGEEDDENAPAVPATTSNVAEDDPIKAQLEEMNRRIAEEQEKIANMAKSLMSKSDTIKIPGLDSDVTGESSADMEQLPFFLRPRENDLQSTSADVLSEKVDTLTNDLPSKEDVRPVVGDELLAEKREKNEPPIVDLDDDSYSPFENVEETSKEDDSVILGEGNNAADAADNEVLPQIPGFGDHDLSSMAPILSKSEVHKPSSMDIELEAPPVGEVTPVVAQGTASKPKIALDSVFSRKAPGSALKPKIQINLKSKLESLAKEDNSQEKSKDFSTVPKATSPHATSFTLLNASAPSVPTPTIPPPGLQGPTTSVPFASFGTNPPIPLNLPGMVPPFMGPGPNIRCVPPVLAMPSMIPPAGVPTMIGGIGINTSIPPPPVPGMQPASSIPPMPISGFGNPGMMPMRHGFEGPPVGMNRALSNVHGFRPGGGRFSMPGSGDFANAPRMQRGHPPRQNSGGFHNDRFRPGQGSSRFRRSRSRSRSPGRNRSRSPSDRDRRRRRHVSNSERSRSPASRRRSRSHSRSRSPRGASNKRRYSRSRSRSPADRRRSRSRRSRSRSDSPNVSTPVVKK